ncbi:MAG: type II toxin-antitoxin system RelE/ParE family toxin [Streptococcaceae bacterium]|jgi:addiction module RelE/StbE family toxin|nr:type II toxin-antitoxin system RelE/ParE family toxin [Streptococcaceae bacterium]
MQENNYSVKNYHVKIAPKIFEQLKDIQAYISNVLLSTEAADNRITELFDEMENLKTFPHRGFNADEKIGTVINQHKKTYGLSIVKGKYIVLYQVVEEINQVLIVDLVPTASDYSKLFL